MTRPELARRTARLVALLEELRRGATPPLEDVDVRAALEEARRLLVAWSRP